MNLIERVASKAFFTNGHLYHSIESAHGFFEGKCKQHGLEGWTFKVVSSTSKRIIGYCSYRRKIVAIHAHFFFAMTADQVEETILHELAHALTPGEGHSSAWRAKAIELGDTHARATTNMHSNPGFRADWMIASGHTRRESTFDQVAFTNTETPKKPKAQKEVQPRVEAPVGMHPGIKAKPSKKSVVIYKEARRKGLSIAGAHSHVLNTLLIEGKKQVDIDWQIRMLTKWGNALEAGMDIFVM